MKKLLKIFSSWSKKKKFAVLFGIFIVLGAFLSGFSKSLIDFEESKIRANQDGVYFVAGNADKNATVQFDGEIISLNLDNGGKFEQLITPQKSPTEKIQEVKVIAKYKGKETERTLEVDNSSYFEYQEKLKEEKRKEAQRQKEAEDDAISKLKEVEANPTRNNLEIAKSFVRKIPQENSDITDRLNKATKEVEDREKEYKAKVDDANSKLSLAEKNPTKDTIAAADSAINSLSEDSKENYSTRLSNVKEKYAKQEKDNADKAAKEKAQAEQAAKTQAEADKKVQAEADKHAAQEQAAQAPQALVDNNNSATVYITPTGKRYHTHPHGNGSFSSTTIENAEAQGYTPCEKCY
ncbi:hypothetical protein [Floricoccus penangensis]|uniref:hypothetical protein n=1 Tax=Floricoccus penangensis TaxID=1859475 RepID=UPI0009F2F494|nr:hypothetical protein [Floricoccus penangensis]